MPSVRTMPWTLREQLFVDESHQFKNLIVLALRCNTDYRASARNVILLFVSLNLQKLQNDKHEEIQRQVATSLVGHPALPTLIFLGPLGDTAQS